MSKIRVSNLAEKLGVAFQEIEGRQRLRQRPSQIMEDPIAWFAARIRNAQEDQLDGILPRIAVRVPRDFRASEDLQVQFLG